MLLYNLQDGTPLRIAIENGNDDIIHTLVLYGADFNCPSFGFVSIIQK